MNGADDRKQPAGPAGVDPRTDRSARPRTSPTGSPTGSTQPDGSALPPGLLSPLASDVALEVLSLEEQLTAYDARSTAPVPRPVSRVARKGESGRGAPAAAAVPGPEDEEETVLARLGGGAWQPSLDDIGDAFDRALSGSFPPPSDGAVPLPPPPAEPAFRGAPGPSAALAPPWEAPVEVQAARPSRAARVALLGVSVSVLLTAAGGVYLRFFHEAWPFAIGMGEAPSREPVQGLEEETAMQAPMQAPTSAPFPEPVAAKASLAPSPEVSPSASAKHEEVESQGLENSVEESDVEEGDVEERVAAAKVLEASPPPDISPKWKKRIVYVGVLRAKDRSRSRVSRLELTLRDGFQGALIDDKHARWRVKSRRVRRGHLVYLDVVDVDVQPANGGVTAAVTCRITAYKKPGRAAKVVREAHASTRVEGAAPPRLRAQLVRDTTRTCSYSLSNAFVVAALR